MTGSRSGARTFLFSALFLVLAACGGGEEISDVPPPPESEAGQVVERSRSDQVAAERRETQRQRRAEALGESKFVYTRYAPDLSGDQPRACIVFSRPLNPETDYSIYAPLDGDVEAAYGVEGEKLCLSGLSFATSYNATLLEGLPAADGSELDREEVVSISFEDRPPYVGFRGAGIILPREDADGLAIETVNVEKVNVTVSRVNDRALVRKTLTQGREGAQGQYAYVYGDENPSDVSSPVWSGEMDIQNVQNAPVVTIFPLPDVIGTLSPGAYYVELTDAKELNRRDGPAASAQRWIMLTDLALTAYRSASGLDVTLRSLQDGRAMPNTTVQLIARNNEVLGEAATGVDGRVSFNAELLAGTGNLSPKIVLASGLKGDTAVLDLTRAPVDLSEEDIGGREASGDVDAYLYTERGIYRPGETVYLTAMMRDRTGRAVKERAGTLITYRPNGMEAMRERFLVETAGTLQRDLTLPRDASRGVWQTVVEMDGLGVAGRVSYSVEDFVPQRIAVDLDVEDAPMLPGDDARDIDVSSRFLYGAPGAGLTVQAQARLELDPNPFGREGFSWGEHTRSFREQFIDFQDRTTDGAGLTTLRLAPEGRGQDADHPLRLNTVVNVLEPGGRAVSESVRIPYRPRDLYLGTKQDFDGRLERGASGAFEIAAVDASGEGVETALDWRIIAIDYHYDWYRENGRWKWRRSRTVRTVNEGTARTDGGRASLPVSDLDWGPHELIVTAPDGAKTSRGFYVGWGGAVSDDGVEAPDRVQVLVDEQVIVPGRPAALTIVPPYDGQAQIVVATDRVLSVESRQVQAAGTQITLPVSEEWGEGAYVMVNVYTQRDPVIQSKPRRAVGVGYVPVDMSSRTFDVEIEAPELARPGTEQTISVKVEGEARDKAYVTLAAVDEGILRLTKFNSPDPAAWYFGKKAMGLSLYDDYGRLLDPNLGLPAEVRSGGDQLGGEGLSVVPTKSIALFSGIVEVGRGNVADVTFDMPEFNGELRLMAVAWSDTALGSASQAMIVRDKAPADLILPRFMAPGDEAVATVSIDNVELESGSFEAALTASGPLDVQASEFTTTVQSGQRVDQGLRFSSDGSGISNLRLNVQGPENYSVARDYQIETRSAYLPVTRIERTLMEAGQTYAPDETVLGGLVPGTEMMTVSFSGLPVDPNALYHSLSRYPYGCTEQTISRALPLIYVEQLVDEGADGSRGSAQVQVQEAVTRVLNRQSENGAFGLWREGDGNASPWLGAYTTDFLYRAKEAGYEVPQAALDRAYQSMRSVAQGDAWRVYGYETDAYESRWHSDTEQLKMQRASAYALYVLARAGKADVSRLRYLHDRELSSMRSPLARAHLAAALSYMGDRSRAFSAFEAAEEALGYDNNGDYYQTPLRDLAGVLSLAAETGFNDQVSNLAGRLGEDVPEPDQLTTQEKAYLLLGVNSLSQEDGLSLDVDGLGRSSDNDRRYWVTADQLERGVSFRLRRGSSPIFRTVMITGAPEAAPPPTSSDLSVSKTLRTTDGGRVNLSSVTQGDQFVVAVTLTPRQRRNNPVIVADLLPAGFEIETVLRPSDGLRDDGPSGAYAFVGEINAAQTAEARDDRFVAAIDVVNEPRTIAYVVRAVTPGTFAMPGVVAEDMYRPDVFARSAATEVVIAPQVTATGGDR
ncbi:MAG: alpha-2-macroglobulin [Henriciella sp.]|nr:alpha-2-macroglobulin [Henriciella sp.]